jgi:predicted  nucleic acid-binding Zn-ribbon protein
MIVIRTRGLYEIILSDIYEDPLLGSRLIVAIQTKGYFVNFPAGAGTADEPRQRCSRQLR